MNHILVFPEEARQGRLNLKDARAQHILRILKITPSGSFRMGVLNESKGIATLHGTDARFLSFSYHQQEKPEDLLPVTLLMGATRPIVLSRILRDATAFGVQRFLITHTENSEKSYLQSRLWQNEQYRQPIYEGLALARGVTMPSVQRCFSLGEALKQVNSSCRILAEENAKDKLSQLQYSLPFTLAVGPERGFTAGEITFLQTHGFAGGRMGNRILRSETACFTALSAACCAAGLF